MMQAAEQNANAPKWWTWKNQVATITRMELTKNFFTRRGLWIYILAFAPAVIIFFHGMDTLRSGRVCNLQGDTTIMGGIFQVYYMRLGIFFGCMGIFTWLFRGEVMEKSLHYYFLSPIRREVLVVSKFLAGAITVIVQFGMGVFTSFFLMYAHMGAQGKNFVFNGPGLGHLMAYLGVTALAVIGYGAIFLALSLVFKNPIIPGAVVLGWETISSVLPPTLQKLSITFYLKYLVPVPIQARGIFALFTVVAEPVPSWLAVTGMLLLSMGILYLACLRIRTMEITYSSE